MSPLGSIGSLLSTTPNGPASLAPTPGCPGCPTTCPPRRPPAPNFHGLLEGLVQAVDGQQAKSDALTSQVLLGDSSQLHQSVIAMQEASTALSLMVQVRNKLVESYQQLMSMQV